VIGPLVPEVEPVASRVATMMPVWRKARLMRKPIESEAIEALRDTLQQISVIKVKEISVDSHAHRGDRTIFGHIEIYGHAHLLACRVIENGDAPCVKKALHKLQQVQKHRGRGVMSVLIAPVMSEDAQKVCRESDAGFLDLAGNARLYLDEVFIVKRSLPHHKELPSQAEKLPKSETAHFAQVA